MKREGLIHPAECVNCDDAHKFDTEEEMEDELV